ncbi:MAG: hypothetical protein ACJASS_002058 [Sulfitobacter sp.]
MLCQGEADVRVFVLVAMKVDLTGSGCIQGQARRCGVITDFVLGDPKRSDHVKVQPYGHLFLFGLHGEAD